MESAREQCYSVNIWMFTEHPNVDRITGPSKVTTQADLLMNVQTILVIGKYVAVNIFAQGGKNSNPIVI